MTSPAAFVEALEAALLEYRFRDAEVLIRGIDPAPFELKQIRKSLQLLRRKRQFSAMEQLASMFFMAGHQAPVIRRQWAQSLLDQNRIVQALTSLRELARVFANDPGEGPEIRGLVGRAYKQLYVNEGGKENLAAAIAAYKGDWQARRGDYRWHGINLVALSQRALDDGIAEVAPLDPRTVARELLDDIDAKGAGGYWDYATALEASIALNDTEGTFGWLKKYVRHPDTDAFELGSTLRQLKEIWRLVDAPLARKLLPVLEFELLQRKGAIVEPTGGKQVKDPAGFEAVYGGQGYMHVQWMDSLYACFNGVARIHNRVTGAAEGTGFLLPGHVLKKEWSETPVLLTNSHVISVNAADQAPLRPEDAAAEFTRLPGRPQVAIGEILYSSSRASHDVTITRIVPPAQSSIFEFTPYLPALAHGSANAPGNPERAYVIGHPKGGELAVSLYDNNLVEYQDQYVRYRSPTDGGSSGSPVCTRQLKVFAIHHRAVADKQLNEGISLQSIKEGLQLV